MKNARVIIKKIFFSLLFLYSVFFVLGCLLPPVLAHLKFYDLSGKITSVFMFSCHQQPDRTFWILGYPMALCCRCTGVYLGCAASSALAVFNRFKINLKMFILFAFLSILDVFINYGLGKRLNTGNVTRFIAGILFGIVIVAILNYLINMKGKNDEIY